MKTGKLSVVSVPIGNKDDITLRAIAVLKSVDEIIAEDTRQAKKLLSILGINASRVSSYREQNHDLVLPQIVAKLKQGKHLALITDRGTPTISDPGSKLISELHKHSFEIVSVPGPSALVAALSISGLPSDRFVFVGFLPRMKSKQQKLLKYYGDLKATFVIYESPQRLIQLLENILETLGDIEIALVHELTKVHEEVLRGKVSIIISRLKAEKLIRGEWVIVGRKTT